MGIPLRPLRTLVLGVLLTLVVAPIVAVPYTADDTINRTWAAQPLGTAIRSAWDLNQTWMFEQGRFFPGGSVYALTMWNLMDSRVAYATYLALINLACIGLLALVAWYSTKSALAATLAALAMAACTQLRFGYLDGVASFAGLVPYTLALALGASLLLAGVLAGRPRWLVIPAVLMWILAITAYEVSLLMLPAILVMLYVTGPSFRERARWLWAVLPLAIPALAQLSITLYLRSPDLPLAPGYQINPGGPVGETFLKQFTAALPFSQQGWLSAPINPTLSILLALVLALPLILLWRPWVMRGHLVPLRVSIGMVVAGAWAWGLPSLLAGVTRRWQDELVWGHGYIYLPYQFAGLALAVAGLAGVASLRLPAPWGRLAFAAIFMVMALAVAVTAGVNIVNVGTIVPGPQGPA